MEQRSSILHRCNPQTMVLHLAGVKKNISNRGSEILRSEQNQPFRCKVYIVQDEYKFILLFGEHQGWGSGPRVQNECLWLARSFRLSCEVCPRLFPVIGWVHSQKAGLGWKLLHCSASHSHCHAVVLVTRYRDGIPATRGSPVSVGVRPQATSRRRSLMRSRHRQTERWGDRARRDFTVLSQISRLGKPSMLLHLCVTNYMTSELFGLGIHH